MENAYVLVDAKNILYRAAFANRHERKNSSASIFLKLVRPLLQWKPKDLLVFWDSPKETVWRRRILPTYKERTGGYYEEVADDLKKSIPASRELLTSLGIRQFEFDTVEADDLIYNACEILMGNPSIIVSSDSDYRQLSYKYQNIHCYDPAEKKLFDRPTHNPVIIKALMGDKSDNISGYKGIGEVRSANIASNNDTLFEFVKNDPQLFARNIALIDLSLCPLSLAIRKYLMASFASPLPEFNKEAVNTLAMKHKVIELISDYTNLVLPFKNYRDSRNGGQTEKTAETVEATNQG